jgi:predicted RNA-binding protein with PIN domain
MHIIVDGYNLLGALGRSFQSHGPFSEAARESLLRELGAYRHRKGHPVTVVFDGWQQGQPSEAREHRAGVHVVYSKRGERADQVIQRLARQYGSDCAVVSSDGEIIVTAKAHGAVVMKVQEFASKLHHTSSTVDAAHKELDPGEDIPRRSPEKKGNPRKLPKAVRWRARQLKQF